MDIGKNIQNLRKKTNITQQDLADMLGISRSAICRIESKPSIDTNLLEKISTAFNVPVISLLYDEKDDISNYIAADMINSVKSIRTLNSSGNSLYKKLPDKTKNFTRALGIQIYKEIIECECISVKKFARSLKTNMNFLFDKDNKNLQKTCTQFIDTFTANWLENTYKGKEL
ncbi:helix-turn-helix domain-containing protein [Clostridium sp. ZS2-4]|uniref:helix-turn-helix domain-containing protein n=1 Tax=Clostridium sp. ZS2-4 TaxID=2987703 RepID=UPI00227A8312|nr:helix-turn-helix transcriptional regulator [Clostridium sp. ZS2-4]MCY6355108.1 helix-turn-helix transcriptional regulator [Clostridium sp. ZS2-4]